MSMGLMLAASFIIHGITLLIILWLGNRVFRLEDRINVLENFKRYEINPDDFAKRKADFNRITELHEGDVLRTSEFTRRGYDTWPF